MLTTKLSLLLLILGGVGLIIYLTPLIIKENFEKPNFICQKDEDCKILNCQEQTKIYCPSVMSLQPQCINQQCLCQCVLPKVTLPASPKTKEIKFQGKIYVKTQETYKEYIPEEFKINLEDGSSIYLFNKTVYTLELADPFHHSYLYAKWIEKK